LPSCAWQAWYGSDRDGNRVIYMADNEHVSAMLHEGLHHADHVVQAHPNHPQP